MDLTSLEERLEVKEKSFSERKKQFDSEELDSHLKEVSSEILKVSLIKII